MRCLILGGLALLLGLSACTPLSTQPDSAAGPDQATPLTAVTLAPAAAPAQAGQASARLSAADVLADAPQSSVSEPSSPLQSPGLRLAASHVTPLSAPLDLWERIRRGFAMADLDTELVRDRERWYTARPESLHRLTERSRKYIFYIVEELERRNMPTELALLPFVESAFNPQAVSSAKAAGIWQFMPNTGKSFDLKQNAFRDDRRDILASTRAALDYLQSLYTMFGDWQLALAAYNWGQGNVGRALAKQQKTGASTAYADLPMPAETRLYVPSLQALKNIVRNPQGFGVALSGIGNHPYFDTVTLSRDMDVALAAKLANVSVEDFKALNPSMNRPLIMAAATPQILLPWDNATRFSQALANYNGPTASWTVWVAPNTMRASEAAKRVGMDEVQLRQINHIPAGMLVGTGSMLVVPRATHVAHDVQSILAEVGQVSLAPEPVARPSRHRAGSRSRDLAQRSASNKPVNEAASQAGIRQAKGKTDRAGAKRLVIASSRPIRSLGTETKVAKR